MNTNKELSFLDLISIASFCIGLMNLDENITQGDLADKTDRILTEIHDHLTDQDQKIDWIMEKLGYDTRRNF